MHEFPLPFPQIRMNLLRSIPWILKLNTPLPQKQHSFPKIKTGETTINLGIKVLNINFWGKTDCFAGEGYFQGRKQNKKRENSKSIEGNVLTCPSFQRAAFYGSTNSLSSDGSVTFFPRGGRIFSEGGNKTKRDRTPNESKATSSQTSLSNKQIFKVPQGLHLQMDGTLFFPLEKREENCSLRLTPKERKNRQRWCYTSPFFPSWLREERLLCTNHKNMAHPPTNREILSFTGKDQSNRNFLVVKSPIFLFFTGNSRKELLSTNVITTLGR